MTGLRLAPLSAARYGPFMTARRLAPEVLAWLVGVAFRIGLFRGFNPRMGYDTNAHTGYMAYIAEHGAIPPIDLVWTANHPPLYYALCALLHELGAWPNFEVQRLQVLSVAFAIARLTVLWWGLRQVLPTSLGRAAALLLAGILPCAVHGDGMISNETMNGLVGTVAIIAAYRAFAVPSTRRGVALFFALLVALLTKISGLLVAAAVGFGILLVIAAAVARHRTEEALAAGHRTAEASAASGRTAEASAAGRRMKEASAASGRTAEVRAMRPIAGALVLSLAIAVPIYARHRASTGLLLPTSFERNEKARQQQASLPPYLQRRPLSYYTGLSFARLYATPHYPTVVDQFPMVALATTFTDYYNYSFVTPPSGVPQRQVNHRPLAAHTEQRMRISLIGGAVISLVLLLAYLVITFRAVLALRIEWLVPLAVPAAGVLGQLHYATKYPFDYMGLVKSLYLQFGWAPVFACFGAVVAWSWARPVRRPLFGLIVVAMVAVAQYSVHGVFEW